MYKEFQLSVFLLTGRWFETNNMYLNNFGVHIIGTSSLLNTNQIIAVFLNH